jgi:hypothetical protein
MNEFELIDTLEVHLQKILQQQGLQRIWGEKPYTYIVHGLDLQQCFHEVIQRVWVQKLNGEINLYVLEGQLVFQLEDAIYSLAHVFLYRPHVANTPTGVQRHRKGDPPLRDWSMLDRRYSTYLDSVFEKLYTFWNHQATLCNYYLPKSLKPHAVDFSRVIDQIPAELHHLEAYQWLRAFKASEYKAFNEIRRHVVHYGPFGARHSLKLGELPTPEQERQQRLDYLNAPLQLRDMILLARESYYHLLRLLVAMDALYFPSKKG